MTYVRVGKCSKDDDTSEGVFGSEFAIFGVDNIYCLISRGAVLLAFDNQKHAIKYAYGDFTG